MKKIALGTQDMCNMSAHVLGTHTPTDCFNNCNRIFRPTWSFVEVVIQPHSFDWLSEIFAPITNMHDVLQS